MKCKLSEKCKFGNLCKDATRHDSLTVLGCSSFKTKEPMTNEEYIRTCSTEELVSLIVCELRNTDLHNMKLKYNLFNGNDFDAVRVWLKEKHND